TKCNPSGPRARVSCGYSGISKKGCTDRGCCFDDSVPQVVWCYQPVIQAVKHDCSAVHPHKRAKCGPPGVSPDECTKYGCCFDSSVAGVPWCFQPEVKKGWLFCCIFFSLLQKN
ncbi:hypothetical protein AB205_0008500, partial [Aquarana catesbeiana]